MLVIQHRANELSTSLESNITEIDVHLSDQWGWTVKHDIRSQGWRLDYFLDKSESNKFFVDIKQNLSINHYVELVKLFGDRLVGLFDLPMPSAYFATSSKLFNLPIYLRVSEFEFPNKLSNKYWIDPLCSQSAVRHSMIFNKIRDMHENPRVIFACPSLHGKELPQCKSVWNWIKNMSSLDKRFVQGVVTKHVAKCQEIINATS